MIVGNVVHVGRVKMAMKVLPKNLLQPSARRGIPGDIYTAVYNNNNNTFFNIYHHHGTVAFR